jgi:EpsD family peptidyl-prolyl cis-trans isomerase
MSVFRLGRALPVTALLATCSLVLISCSKKIEETTENPKSQVVARVGEDVVTTQELENEFRISQVPAEKRKDPAAVKQVLGELVTRKFLARRALEAKLDREPTVLLDILRAREIVLAKAAGSRDLAKKSSTIGGSEIDAYISNNPLRFANRQIANIEQITLSTNGAPETVVEATRDMKSLDEVDQELTAFDIVHSRSTGVLSSGDISTDIFQRILKHRPDDIFFLKGQPNSVFFKVNSIENRPLRGEGALKAARQALQFDLLKSEASLASVEATLSAKFEGEYADLMKMQSAADIK